MFLSAVRAQKVHADDGHLIRLSISDALTEAKLLANANFGEGAGP